MGSVLKARASYSGYIVFSVMWIPIALLFVFVAISQHKYEALVGAAIPLFICLGFVVWLSGFCIVIDNERFRYRDGLYRWNECDLSEIENAQQTWVSWDVGTKIIRIPRFVVKVRGSGKLILINTKPFTRSDLKKLNEIMKPLRR